MATIGRILGCLRGLSYEQTLFSIWTEWLPEQESNLQSSGCWNEILPVLPQDDFTALTLQMKPSSKSIQRGEPLLNSGKRLLTRKLTAVGAYFPEHLLWRGRGEGGNDFLSWRAQILNVARRPTGEGTKVDL